MILAASPPGPEGTYLVGNLLDYARDPLLFLTRCSREYGDVVRLRLPGPPVYLLNAPEHIEQVLVKNNRNFIKGRYFRQELSFLGRAVDQRRGVLAPTEAALTARFPPKAHQRLR